MSAGNLPIVLAVLAAAAWLLLSLVTTASTVLYYHRVRNPLAPAPGRPRVALLVAIKGAGPGTEAFLDALARQENVDHRLVFAVESASDPVCAVLDRFMARSPVPAMRVEAGLAQGRGQKVHNLLAALSTLTARDEIIAFTDADTLPPPDWLAQLVRPLALGRADVSNGYIWTIPTDGQIGSRLAALLSVAVATTPRFHAWNLCSGAAMALRHEALQRMDLRAAWSNTLSDDLALSVAARRAGLHVHPTHRVLAPSPVSHGVGSLTAYARRQYLILRLYAPGYWLTALAALLPPVPLLLLMLPLLHVGLLSMLAVPAVAMLLQQVRQTLRMRIADRLLPPEQAARSRTTMRRDRWLLPLLPVVNLVLLLSTAFGRRITWAGIRYHVHGAERMEVLSRAGAASAPAPSGFVQHGTGRAFPQRLPQRLAPVA